MFPIGPPKIKMSIKMSDSRKWPKPASGRTPKFYAVIFVDLFFGNETIMVTSGFCELFFKSQNLFPKTDIFFVHF